MDKLLQPNIGLMVWTAISFLILVFVLGRFAWKPILVALEKREGKIRSDLEQAEKSQREAEALRLKYERDLAEAQRKMQEMVNAARAEGGVIREKIIRDARDESEKLLEKGRRELSLETERLKDELKKDVADLSLGISEKILERSVDKKVAEEVVKESLAALRGPLKERSRQ